MENIASGASDVVREKSGDEDRAIEARRRHYENIRSRYRRRGAMQTMPDLACPHCGSRMWNPDDNMGGWYCLKCGERGFWRDEGFICGGGSLDRKHGAGVPGQGS